MNEIEKLEMKLVVIGASASGVSMAIRVGYEAIGLGRQDEAMGNAKHVLEALEELEHSLQLEWEAQEKELTLLAPDSPRRMKRTPAGEAAAALEKMGGGRIH